MKLMRFVPLLLALAVLAGCQKSSSPTVVTPVTLSEDSLPTEAQPKLATMKLYLGAEVLDAELALTPRERQTGLMYRTNINDETAMLFVFSQSFRAPNGFWMTNCPISLSAAYIGPDGVVEEIHHLEKNDNTPVVPSNDNIVYVLEVNEGWFTRHNINPGTVIRTEKGSLAETFLQNRP